MQIVKNEGFMEEIKKFFMLQIPSLAPLFRWSLCEFPGFCINQRLGRDITPPSRSALLAAAFPFHARRLEKDFQWRILFLLRQ